MANRIRSTWRRASAPPAVPTEDGGHPASYEQPEVDEYGTGTPSDWAEDPHPGPYGPADHPAVPTEDGEHPASRMARAERAKFAAAERKAMKCLKMAEAMLRNASESVLEAQALAFMHMDDRAIDASLERLRSASSGKSRSASMEFFAEEDDLHAEEYLDAEEELLAELLEEEGMLDAEEHDLHADEDDTDTLLAELLEEEGMLEDDELDDDLEAEQLLAEMLAEEGDQNDPQGPTLAPEVDEDLDPAEAHDRDAEFDLDMDVDEDLDPMGVMGGGEDEAAMIAEYLGMGKSAKKADEDEDSDEEEDSDEDEDSDDDHEDGGKESGKKKASQRPQPRKPSQGPKTLGAVSPKTASEVGDLSSLWESAPDVSDFFN